MSRTGFFLFVVVDEGILKVWEGFFPLNIKVVHSHFSQIRK